MYQAMERPWLQRMVLKWLFGNPTVLVKYDNQEVEMRAQLRYAKEGDAGLDLYNASGEEIEIKPGESKEVPAGVRLKIPDGYVGFIRCRSSSFSKRGLFVVHNTIDSGYVGPMFTTVWYPGLNGWREPQIIKPWERLSQIIVVPYLFAEIYTTQNLPKTQRGDTGFGSTGR